MLTNNKTPHKSNGPGKREIEYIDGTMNNALIAGKKKKKRKMKNDHTDNREGGRGRRGHDLENNSGKGQRRKG